MSVARRLLRHARRANPDRAALDRIEYLVGEGIFTAEDAAQLAASVRAGADLGTAILKMDDDRLTDAMARTAVVRPDLTRDVDALTAQLHPLVARLRA